MAGRLEGKVALITGGGSGIGRACALRFAAEGAAICAADRYLEGAAETVQLVEASGGSALAVQVDTSNEEGCEQMVARCLEGLGGVDVLVAAAGVARPTSPVAGASNGLVEGPMAHFNQVFEINFFGVLYSDRSAAKAMLAAGRGGSIVNIASIMAKIPSVGGAYSISKAAVWMLTKCLALELAPAGIRVNAIGPGFIDTPLLASVNTDESVERRFKGMAAMGRFGRPEEIANTALFLASEEASFFTGELLHPSGGVFVG